MSRGNKGSRDRGIEGSRGDRDQSGSDHYCTDGLGGGGHGKNEGIKGSRGRGTQGANDRDGKPVVVDSVTVTLATGTLGVPRETEMFGMKQARRRRVKFEVSLNEAQTQALRALYAGALAGHETLANERHVENMGDTIRLMIDRCAAAMAKPSGSTKP